MAKKGMNFSLITLIIVFGLTWFLIDIIPDWIIALTIAYFTAKEIDI